MNCDDEIVKRKLYYDGLKQVIKDPIPKKQAKDEALLRRWSFDRLRNHTAENAQGIGGAWWFA